MGNPEAGGVTEAQESQRDWNFKALLALQCILRSFEKWLQGIWSQKPHLPAAGCAGGCGC